MPEFLFLFFKPFYFMTSEFQISSCYLGVVKTKTCELYIHICAYAMLTVFII
jgi:hypothetical protein